MQALRPASSSHNAAPARPNSDALEQEGGGNMQ